MGKFGVHIFAHLEVSFGCCVENSLVGTEQQWMWASHGTENLSRPTCEHCCDCSPTANNGKLSVLVSSAIFCMVLTLEATQSSVPNTRALWGKRVHLIAGFPGTRGYILHLPGPGVAHKTGFCRKKGHVSEPTQSHMNSHLEILELMVSTNKKVLIIKSNFTLNN